MVDDALRQFSSEISTTVLNRPIIGLKFVFVTENAPWAWKRQRRGPKGQAEAAAEARSAAFFVVMLLYPRVSAKIFAVLRCRWLGPESIGPSVLEADYSVSCMTGRHEHYMALAGVLVAVIPVGVPLVALAVLLRASRAHRVAHAGRGGADDELGEVLPPLPEQRVE